MAKQGFRVMDSDLHVIEPRTLWEDYIDPKFRGRIVTVPDTSGQLRAHVDGKVLPPYADRPERQRAWSLRMDRPGWDRIRRGTTSPTTTRGSRTRSTRSWPCPISRRRRNARFCGTIALDSTTSSP